MRATLKFNLPEEKEEFNLAINGSKFYSTINEFDGWLRNIIKYDDTISEKEHEIYINCRKKLYDILLENDINIENL